MLFSNFWYYDRSQDCASGQIWIHFDPSQVKNIIDRS
jgi:hypothetical protein